MRRAFFAAQILAIVVGLTSCGPKTTGPSARAPAASRAVTEAMVDRLIPGMGAASIPEREKPQQEFEQYGFFVGQPGREPERTVLCEVVCTRLGSQTAKPARVWMLRQIERIGRDESVPALTKLLDDSDGEIRDLARRALQNNPAAAAGAALRAALTRAKTPDWRVALINALGARRDEACVAELAKLAGGPDRATATAAIAALGDIGNAEAVAALAWAWKDGPAELREVTAVARLRCAERLAAHGQTEAASRIFEETYASDLPLQVRMGGLRGLATTRGEQVFPALLKIITDESADAELRAVAADLAADIPGAMVTAALAQPLPNASKAAQVLLVRALAERGDATARPVVASLLKSESADVRIAALRALQALGDRTSAVQLAQAAAGAEGAERDAARLSLARLRGPGVDEAMLGSIRGSDAAVRVELIRGLTARRCKAALPLFFEQADEADEAVRIAALAGLGELAGDYDAPGLVRLLAKAEPEAVRTAAEDATVAVCNRAADLEQRATPVLAVWASATPAVRATLVHVLGRVGGTAALEKIRAASRVEDADLVDAAVRALANWPKADVLDDLLDLAQHGDSNTHRVLALKGYVRLVGLPSERDSLATLEMYKTAMSLTQRPDEQKAVLAVLAGVPRLEAMQMAQRYLTDEGLKAEAESAVVAIAARIGPVQRAEARTALEVVMSQTANKGTRERAQKALDTLRKSEGAIATWLVSGPYFEEGLRWEQLLDRSFGPEQPRRKDVVWQPMKITDEQQPWVFDLSKIDAGTDRCVYVRSAIWSEKQQPAQLEVGSDDAVKVWLNGRLVHQVTSVRSHNPLQDKVAVTLDAGWNTLLLKVVQATGGWGFSAAVSSPDGKPLPGLKFQAEGVPESK